MVAPFQELSYEVHTGRELELMLRGLKPLAWFSDLISDNHDMPEPDEGFEHQVQSGAFIKHEIQELWEPFALNGHLIKGRWTRFYALKDEAWRIPAFLLLRKIADKHPWNDALERLEGSLLGYTDDENDEWLAKHHERHAGWACMTLYAMITTEVLEQIAGLGNKAVPKQFLSKARLFSTRRIPARSDLEKTGLFSAKSYNKLIRFGVDVRFFRAHMKVEASESLSSISMDDHVGAKELNAALRTDIQVLEPKGV